jgi:hypothetical protein
MNAKTPPRFLPFGLLIVMAGLNSCGCGQMNLAESLEEQDVMAVLKKFQSGYDVRDISKVDEYVRNLFDAQDVLVIGTGAAYPGDGEWCEGIDRVKSLVESDWRYWGDLKMETDKARIRIDGSTAWVAFSGVSESFQTREAAYRKGMQMIKDQQKQKKYRENPREYFLWLSNYASSMLWDLEQEEGEKFIHPIRITAVLSNKNGKWLFTQMNFAYPTGNHKKRITRTQ